MTKNSERIINLNKDYILSADFENPTILPIDLINQNRWDWENRSWVLSDSQHIRRALSIIQHADNFNRLRIIINAYDTRIISKTEAIGLLGRWLGLVGWERVRGEKV